MMDNYYDDRVKELLAQGMGMRLHWFPTDISATRLAEVLVGMANSDGGSVLLGISPRSTHIQGVSDLNESIDRLIQAAVLVDPPLVLPLPEEIPCAEGSVLLVSVPQGLPNIYSLDGRFLWRQGAQTCSIPARELRQLMIERGFVQFESQAPSPAQLADLDLDKVAAYARSLNLPDNPSVEEILVWRGCLTSDLRPTYAGLLLFGRTVQQWLPAGIILAARFSGPSFADQYIKMEILGTLPEQLRQAEAFTRQHLSSVVELSGLERQELPEYPLEAVRELLVNAVAHRDYSLQGDSIHLNIFSDRIEVQSPGGLPGPVTLENLLEARFSRNAVIVQVLSDMGFIERLGYGLDRVMRVMRQRHLPPPRFEEVAGTFRVTLYSREIHRLKQTVEDIALLNQLELNPRQELVLSYLSDHRRITSRDYQELCEDVHPETLRRDLADLVSRNILIKVGDKRATYYIIKK